MPERVERESRERAPLSRERVLRGAVAVRRRGGIGSLTMRSLARELDVKPMSLYHHVANKDEILDGIVDLVFGEIELPSPDGDWRPEMHRRAISARLVLRRHPWAIGLMESRATPAPRRCATYERHRHLRGAGFSVQMTAHAYALLDSYIYGFALQEAMLPFSGPETVAEVAEPIMQQMSADKYPTSPRWRPSSSSSRIRLRQRVRVRARRDPRRPREVESGRNASGRCAAGRQPHGSGFQWHPTR